MVQLEEAPTGGVIAGVPVAPHKAGQADEGSGDEAEAVRFVQDWAGERH